MSILQHQWCTLLLFQILNPPINTCSVVSSTSCLKFGSDPRLPSQLRSARLRKVWWYGVVGSIHSSATNLVHILFKTRKCWWSSESFDDKWLGLQSYYRDNFLDFGRWWIKRQFVIDSKAGIRRQQNSYMNLCLLFWWSRKMDWLCFCRTVGKKETSRTERGVTLFMRIALTVSSCICIQLLLIV